ncbi:AGAP012526-PA [Anopheles gambiae str. PEST]|uniref:phosphogluconate dehydrogenase (NADP(+)-dependent, decarboxylating) n=2 Tax=gambiae species complex TaxID=44542 RepID=A0NAX7_ANOGA|nr:AGAP012526-PA [Anopheles gambiae str. PEST]
MSTISCTCQETLTCLERFLNIPHIGMRIIFKLYADILFASNLTVVRSLNAGHFVNMVHNGIEYGDMQLICEACHLLLIDFKFAMPKEDNLNVQQEDHDE